MSNINERLNQILSEKNITKSELSKLLPFSESGISKYFIGKNFPGRKFLNLLEEKLNVNPAWVMYGQGSMFLDETQVGEQEYPNLTRLIKATNLTENELIDLIEVYLKLPFKQIINLIASASKGNKNSLVKLQTYFSSLETLLEE